MTDNEAALIACHVEIDPYHPGPGDARLVASGVPVWAVIGHLSTVRGDSAQAAADYEITPEAMEAALAYYRGHREAIDARLAANAGKTPAESRAPA
jgi:uncharacterized protein (DUF433 family)